jgi:pyruvate/2-oxoglutarate dehydrogenase complex dihydrolipoamide dehydrogenase (E3) component
LGGQLYIASKPPYKEEIGNFIDYFSKQLHKCGVNIVLNKEIKEEDVEKLNADIVLVAAGSEPFIPPIEGLHLANAFTAQEILLDPSKVYGNVVVIGGGGTGLETAEFLLSKGHKVTIVEMLDDIAVDEEPNRRKLIITRLSKAGVRILTHAKVTKLTSKEVTIDWNGNAHVLQADSVVFAAGVRPDKKVGEEISSTRENVYFIGNCDMAGCGLDAIHAGFEIGYKLFCN